MTGWFIPFGVAILALGLVALDLIALAATAVIAATAATR